MNRYEEVSILGDGGFGTVTKCLDKETQQYVAIKKIKQRYNSFEECLQLKEVKSLRKIKHQNVERLLQIFREHEYLYLVFELLGESLLTTMNKRGKPFLDDEVRNIMKQTLSGVAYVHRLGFFHRDLKPDNLLWGGDVLKLADFGLAREIRSRPPYTEYVGTRWYRAPEIILHHEFYNSPVDVWACGAIMAELYLGKPIFQGNSETDQLFKIINVLGTPTSQIWPDAPRLANKSGIRFPQVPPTSLSSLMPNASPDAIALMQAMLQYDPAKRPSAAQCLKFKFFDSESSSILPHKLAETMIPINKRNEDTQIFPQILSISCPLNSKFKSDSNDDQKVNNSSPPNQSASLNNTFSDNPSYEIESQINLKSGDVSSSPSKKYLGPTLDDSSNDFDDLLEGL